MADFNVIGTLILTVKAAAIFASENIFVNTYPHWFNYSSWCFRQNPDDSSYWWVSVENVTQGTNISTGKNAASRCEPKIYKRRRCSEMSVPMQNTV